MRPTPLLCKILASSLSNSVESNSTETDEDSVEYYNFNTHHRGTSSVKPKVSIKSLKMQLSEKRPAISSFDHLPLYSTFPHTPDDPYRDIPIFRRDMADGRGVPSLSVDVPFKTMMDLFADFDSRRCKLCNETFLQWNSHKGGVPHAGREAMAIELLRAHCGKPEEIVERLWYRLHTSTHFNRIRSLSHMDSHQRKRRVQYLLRFLVERKVLVDTFSLLTSDISSAGRTWEFERLEFIGDNVVKYLLNDRLSCCFPPSEGGIRGRLGYFQFVMDGNEGLARTYDYLELQHLVKSEKVVSKFKSDVVETLFGELQFYLFSTVQDFGTEEYLLPFSRASHSLRDIVEHVMEELAHVFFMHHVEVVLDAVLRVSREKQLHFIKTEPIGADTASTTKGTHNKNLILSRVRTPIPRGGSSKGDDWSPSVVQPPKDFSTSPPLDSSPVKVLPSDQTRNILRSPVTFNQHPIGEEATTTLLRSTPFSSSAPQKNPKLNVKLLKSEGLLPELL